MTDRYYNPAQPGSFGGLPIAERYLKGNVKDFLIRQDADTLHRPIRHRFRRRKIFTKEINDLWQADLVDMQSLSLHNDGVKYLLTGIDTFSKYAWVRPLKNKSGLCVKKAFESILKEKVPLYLQSDKGTEFKNTLFQSQLTEYEIKFYMPQNDDIKSPIVERFNRTLKTRMYGYFTHSKVIDMSTCYKTWCTRIFILITAVSEWLLARMVGRNFHHQQEISHYTGHLCDQGCGG